MTKPETLPQFTIDGYANNYDAIAYGPTWNGWATPIVTRETLAALIGEYPEENTVTFDADGVATIAFTEYPDEPMKIAPNTNGNYDLGCMGYTFDTVDSDTNAPHLNVKAGKDIDGNDAVTIALLPNQGNRAVITPDGWGDRAVVVDATPCTEHAACRVLTVAPDETDTLEYPHVRDDDRIAVETTAR